MGKLSGKLRNAATQAYADAKFNDFDIMRRSLGEHNNEPMSRIYQRIVSDPSISRVETKKPGRYDLVYHAGEKEAIVGWLDQNRGMGEISQKAYDHIQDIETNGVYVIKKDDKYAVRAYAETIGRDGKYVSMEQSGEESFFSFDDKKFTAFDSYAEAKDVAWSVSENLGLDSCYERDDDGLSENTEERYQEDMGYAGLEDDGDDFEM